MLLDQTDDPQPQSLPNKLWAIICNIGYFFFIGFATTIVYFFPNPRSFADFLGISSGSNIPEIIVFTSGGIGIILMLAAIVFWIIYWAKIYNIDNRSLRPSALPPILGLASIGVSILAVAFYAIVYVK